MILVFSEELVAEAHALCTRLESMLQDTVKTQDHSFTVTTLRDPSLSVPPLSAAKEETWCQPWLSRDSRLSIFKSFIIISG